MAQTKVRNIITRATTIRTGDEIRVTWTEGDTTNTIQGVVAHTIISGAYTYLTTRQDFELLHYGPGEKLPTLMQLIKGAPAPDAATLDMDAA